MHSWEVATSMMVIASGILISHHKTAADLYDMDGTKHHVIKECKPEQDMNAHENLWTPR